MGEIVHVGRGGGGIVPPPKVELLLRPRLSGVDCAQIRGGGAGSMTTMGSPFSTDKISSVDDLILSSSSKNVS